MGVSVPRFGEEKEMLENLPVIACPANLVEIKGHKYLVEACALLKQRQFDFKCLLIGDGPERANIESLINAKDLEDRVFLKGYYTHSKLIRMLEEKQIDLVVLPSIVTREGFSEGIPVALMEAMSFGVPVISTNTGGIPELLVGVAGVLIPEKDSVALAEAIYKVLTDKEIRKKTIQSGYDRVYKDFNLDVCSERLANCIRDNLLSPPNEKVRLETCS